MANASITEYTAEYCGVYCGVFDIGVLRSISSITMYTSILMISNNREYCGVYCGVFNTILRSIAETRIPRECCAEDSYMLCETAVRSILVKSDRK